MHLSDQSKGPQSVNIEQIPAIILAGGLGTRLRTVVQDVPKCMAPVAGHPFLKYLIDALLQSGIRQFIFSLGYKHEIIETYLETAFPELNKTIALETSPLGTGGAVQLACQYTTASDILIVNGDTYFDVQVPALIEFHLQHHAAVTLALKPMRDFSRYGVVELDKDNHVLAFHEKKQYEEGLINGGVYMLNREALLSKELPATFSLETDFLEPYANSIRMMGFIQPGYFIDIGIPDDYERANADWKNKQPS